MPSTVSLSGCTAALGQAPLPVQLHCPPQMQAPLCAALAASLRQRFAGAEVTIAPKHEGSAALALEYVPQHQEQSWISGALAWRHPDGRTGQGPVLELSVMDGPLTDASLEDFAGQLVRHTEFPL